MKSQTNDWLRWIAIFLIVSFGVSLLMGLAEASRDRSPIEFFFGFWLNIAVVVLFPGTIIGGIIALATKRPDIGMWIMIIINSTIAVLLLYGNYLE